MNGEPVDLHMKLGDNGEAFFVQEAEQQNVSRHRHRHRHSLLKTKVDKDLEINNRPVCCIVCKVEINILQIRKNP